MRLCLMIYGRLDTLTGGFLYDKFLVNYLRQKGHTVDIVSLPWRCYGRLLLDNFSPKLRAKLNRTAYDLILQDELNHPSFFWRNCQHQKHSGVPIVSIVHQVLSSQPRKYGINHLYKTVEKIYLDNVDALIFNSETTRNHVQRLINWRPPSIVAPPGGDRLGYLRTPAKIEARARRAGPLELVFVGNISPIKGLVPLLETLIRLPPDIWRLTVVGNLRTDPGHVRRIKHMISTNHIGRQVRLMGALDGRDLVKILAGSHLFVMPFSNETFGIACLEALAYGLPVLASTVGGVKEFIRHDVNGFLVPAGDTQTCAHIILDLHRDRNHLLRISEAALQTALASPGWAEATESIHQFLINLPKQRQKSGPQNSPL